MKLYPKNGWQKVRAIAGSILLFTVLFMVGAAKASNLESAAAGLNACGAVTANTTWALVDSPILVTCDVTVNGSITLTIEPGVEVQFEAAAYDLFVSGILLAQGTPAQPITFTRGAANNNWGGIQINSSGAAMFSHAIIEYGGDPTSNSRQGLLIHSPNVTVSDTVIRDSYAAPLYINNVTSDPTFSNVTLLNNGADRIDLQGNVSLAGNRTLRQIGPNAVPYRWVDGDVTVPNNLVLTVEPGTEVQFANLAHDLHIQGDLVALGSVAQPITFTNGIDSYWGGIRIYGSATADLDHVTIAQAGHVNGSLGRSLWLDTHQVNIANSIIQNGYGTTTPIYMANLSGDPVMSNITLVGNTVNRIDLAGDVTLAANRTLSHIGPTPVPYRFLSNVTVANNRILTIMPGVTVEFQGTSHRLLVDGTLLAAGTPAMPITFTRGQDTCWGGIHLGAAATATFDYAVIAYGGHPNGSQHHSLSIYSPNVDLTNSTVQFGCGTESPIWLSNMSADPFFSNLTLQGNATNYIDLQGDITLTGNRTLANISGPNPIPYRFEGDVTVPVNLQLTVEAGVEVQFETVAKRLFVNGNLVADGTAAQPITFTNGADDYWGGMRIQAGGAAVLDYVVIDSGGHSSGLNRSLSIGSGGVSATNVTVQNGYGAEAPILISNITSDPVFSNLTLTGNAKNFIDLEGNMTLAGSRTLAANIGPQPIPYRFEGDVTIPNGRILTIEPGVEVQFEAAAHDLYVSGNLVALGTITQPITFTNGTDDYWGGIYVNPTGQADFNYVTIAQGGHTSGIARSLIIQSGDVTLANSAIRNGFGADAPVWIRNVPADPIFDNFELTGNGIDRIDVESATLAGNRTLALIAPIAIPYRLEGDVTIPTAYVLTIEPGVTVEMEATGTDLWVDGELAAAGTPAQPILFTNGVANYWGGIYINAGGKATLDYATLERGGHTDGTHARSLWINSNQVSVSNTVVRNGYAGNPATLAPIFIANLSNGDPLLANLSLTGNGVNKIELGSGSLNTNRRLTVVSANPVPYLWDGDVTVPSGRTLTIDPGVQVQFKNTPHDLFVTGSLFALGTAAQPITFTNGVDTHWGGIRIDGGGSATLNYVTIEKGGHSNSDIDRSLRIDSNNVSVANVTIRNGFAGTGAPVWIANLSGGDPAFANLILSGNGNNVIELGSGVLGSNRTLALIGPNPIPYMWDGDVTVPTGRTLTVQPGVTAQFRHTAYDLLVDGSLIAAGSPTQPITFTNGLDAHWGGVRIGVDAAAVLDYVTIEKAGHASGNHARALAIYAGQQAVVSNSTIRDSYAATGAPVWLNMAVSSDPLISNLVLSGNGSNHIELSSATLTGDRTLAAVGPQPVPFRLEGDLTVPHDMVLTVAPGIELQFKYTTTGLWVHGDVMADGTQAQPITFTGGLDTYWEGIYVYTDGMVDLDYVTLAYAGQSNGDIDQALHIRSNTVNRPSTVTNSVIRDSFSLATGIYISDGAEPTIMNTQLLNNRNGIRIVAGRPFLIENSYVGNSDYGVLNESTLLDTLDVRHSWWGDASGPYHPYLNPDGLGDRVSDNLIFDPWLLGAPGDVCTMDLAASHDGANLVLAYDLYSGPTNVFWGNFVNVNGQWQSLFASQLPANLNYQNTFSFPLANAGNVVVFTIFWTQQSGMLCYDFAVVDTGVATPEGLAHVAGLASSQALLPAAQIEAWYTVALQRRGLDRAGNRLQ